MYTAISTQLEGGREGGREGGKVRTHEADEVVVLLGGEAVEHHVPDQLRVGLAGLGRGREGKREERREGWFSVRECEG